MTLILCCHFSLHGLKINCWFPNSHLGTMMSAWERYHTQHQNTIIALSVIRINELLYLPRIAQFLTYEKNKTSNSVGETFSLVSDSNIQFIPRTMESQQRPIALLVGGASGDLPTSVLECGLITVFCRSYSGQAQLPWVDVCINMSCSEDSISAPHPQFLYSFCPLVSWGLDGRRLI